MSEFLRSPLPVCDCTRCGIIDILCPVQHDITSDRYDAIISTFVYTCNERKLVLLRYTLINEALFVQILFSQ